MPLPAPKLPSALPPASSLASGGGGGGTSGGASGAGSGGCELRLGRVLPVPLVVDEGAPAGTALELVPVAEGVAVIASGSSMTLGLAMVSHSRWLAPLLRARAVRCEGALKRPTGHPAVRRRGRMAGGSHAVQVAEVNVFVDVERVDLNLADPWRSLVAALAGPGGLPE
jgi:hypothetical protein